MYRSAGLRLCGKSQVKIEHLGCIEKIDDWCDHCREALMNKEPLDVCEAHRVLSIINVYVDMTHGECEIRPQLLDITQRAISRIANFGEGAGLPLTLVASLHPQLVPLFQRETWHCPDIGRNLVERMITSSLFYKFGKSTQYDKILQVAKTYNARYPFAKLKLAVGLEKLGRLAKSGGIHLADCTRQDVLDNLIKIPEMTELASEEDLERPAKQEKSMLHLIFKKSKDLETHTSLVWLMYPDIFYTIPSMPAFLFQNKRLANKSATFSVVRKSVIQGIYRTLMLGNMDPGSPFSRLDRYCVLKIIRCVFGLRED
jgi:hypothetical protein